MSLELVVFSKALLDIEKITDYLFVEASLRVADRFFDRVHEAIALLPDQPHAGAKARPPIPEGVRIWGVTGFPNHLIYYRPSSTTVQILRVVNCALSRNRLFEPPAR